MAKMRTDLDIFSELEVNSLMYSGYKFLEEAFGGLVRNHNIDYLKLKDFLILSFPRRPSLEEKVWKYIEDADRII